MIGTPLRTARLVIDHLAIADAAAVAAYRSEPSVARYQGWSAPFTVEQAERLAGTGQLALRRAGTLVGDAMVAVVDGAHDEVELGITLAPDAQGRGLASEAVAALAGAAFAAGCVKVVAYVDVRNDASLRLFDRVGFHRDALLAAGTASGDGTTEEVRFALTVAAWRRTTGDARDGTERGA